MLKGDSEIGDVLPTGIPEAFFLGLECCLKSYQPPFSSGIFWNFAGKVFKPGSRVKVCLRQHFSTSLKKSSHFFSQGLTPALSDSPFNTIYNGNFVSKHHRVNFRRYAAHSKKGSSFLYCDVTHKRLWYHQSLIGKLQEVSMTCVTATRQRTQTTTEKFLTSWSSENKHTRITRWLGSVSFMKAKSQSSEIKRGITWFALQGQRKPTRGSYISGLIAGWARISRWREEHYRWASLCKDKVLVQETAGNQLKEPSM